MSIIIEQKPKYQTLPVGQEVIFVVAENTIVANQTQVKFIAEVHIGQFSPPNVSVADNLVGTFKTTPNNVGRGVFDLSNIIESFVSPDNLGSSLGNGSTYKGVDSKTYQHPIHLIDKYSQNDNAVRWLKIQFGIEYLGADTTKPNDISRAEGVSVNSANYSLFNGYLKFTDILDYGGNANQNFGYNWESKFLLDGASKQFLTNAPATQFANIDDYGTIAFLSPEILGNSQVDKIRLLYFNSSGVGVGSIDVTKNLVNGAWNLTGGLGATAGVRMLYFGCFPGNLYNWETTFQTLVNTGAIQGGSIQVKAMSSSSNISQTYTIQLNCPDLRLYEPIRLCWLNQWGVWDYYTFNKKSVRTISTKGSTYTQLGGTWNAATYKVHGYKGGTKSFRVNATEKIRINTDYITVDFNTMLEEMINSPEVYMLESYLTDISNSVLNNYVTPVRLTTSSFTKKTVANDKLIQYTFEIEKSKTLRTQAI